MRRQEMEMKRPRDGNVKENTLDKQKTAWNKCSLQANKSKRRNNQIKGKIRITVKLFYSSKDPRHLQLYSH